ncbi:Transcription elongation factor GreA [Pseudomonas orientalis]|uniref:transcription elongation factor GreA n=1 Tax=Pseudomonas orientalis TaxID=76758 RepID=UPI000F55DFA4|nr:transcription elongation factor GreA [Pseudomonas orientalis]AZE97665.1 Transcription elongation factor GreA [Pseudomonas orientalis]
MTTIAITTRGEKRLKEELAHLKTITLPDIAEKLRTYNIESTEYKSIEEQQGFALGRINGIETTLSAASIIDPSKMSYLDRVTFGATVTVENIDTSEVHQYQIVGDVEADLKTGLIPSSSPLSRALIGKMEGDLAIVNSSDGDIELEILKIEYI